VLTTPLYELYAGSSRVRNHETPPCFRNAALTVRQGKQAPLFPPRDWLHPDRMTQTDLLAAFTGPVPARSERPEIMRHSQGSHDVLLSPADPGGLTLAERAWIAQRVASLSGYPGLAAHYQAMLDQHGPIDASSPREAAIAGHVTRVTTAPGSATRAHIQALRDIGLSERDIVALTQIVAFVSYQVRAAAGLALLAKDPAA